MQLNFPNVGVLLHLAYGLYCCILSMVCCKVHCCDVKSDTTSASVPALSQSVQRPSVTTSVSTSFVTRAAVAPPTAAVAPPTAAVPPGTVAPPAVQSSVPTKFDLLADFGVDPFARPTKSPSESVLTVSVVVLRQSMHRNDEIFIVCFIK